MEVGFVDLVKVDTEDPAVELEAWDAEIVGDFEFVEATPDTRHGLEREGRHDLDLPGTRGSYALSLGSLSSIFLFLLLASLLLLIMASLCTVELEATQEGDTETNGDGLPDDFRIAKGSSEARAKRSVRGAR